jgi:hypothetical protein
VVVHVMLILIMVSGLEASVLNVLRTIMEFVVTLCAILPIVSMEVVMPKVNVSVLRLQKMDTGWASNVMFVFLTTMAVLALFCVILRHVCMAGVILQVDRVFVIPMMNMVIGLDHLVMFAKVDILVEAAGALLSVILVIASMEAVMLRWIVSVNRARAVDTGMDLNATFVRKITMEVNARHSAIRLFVSMAAVL